MKKIIALLLASIMVLGMVACGTTKEDDKKEEAKKPEQNFQSFLTERP